MDNRPIGVFDSGLGGLTAVRRLRQLLPDENIIYFGDTGRMPYGGRPREQMRTIARQNIAFAESFNVKVILAACGTISSNAPDIIAANETKTIGVLLPGAEKLAATGRKEHAFSMIARSFSFVQTGSPFTLHVQAASQSAGQTREVNSGKQFVLVRRRYACS